MVYYISWSRNFLFPQRKLRDKPNMHNLETILYNMTISHEENEEISSCNFHKKETASSWQKRFLDIANEIKRPIGVCYGQFETGVSLVA